MTDLILTEREGAVASVVLNRPERLNAFNLAMWDRLGEVVAELNGDDGPRCIVLRGAGGEAFGAGADIAEFQEARADAAQAKAYAARMEPALMSVERSPHPTLALIQGPCIGGGLELALLCDLRIAGESARFGIPINRIGHCLPTAGMRALIEVVGRPTALEILLEGRILDAGEAAAKGLVTRVVADDEVEREAMAAARRIAAGAPLAARAHKALARRLIDPAPMSEAERAAPFATCDSADYREGIRAFLAKEKPAFQGC